MKATPQEKHKVCKSPNGNGTAASTTTQWKPEDFVREPSTRWLQEKFEAWQREVLIRG